MFGKPRFVRHIYIDKVSGLHYRRDLALSMAYENRLVHIGAVSLDLGLVTLRDDIDSNLKSRVGDANRGTRPCKNLYGVTVFARMACKRAIGCLLHQR